MAKKSFNTAQALLAHVSLKISPIALFGGEVLLKQWTATQRLQYVPYLLSGKENDNNNELDIIRPQANLVILSMVNKAGKPLFPSKWNDETHRPEFEDETGVNTIVEARSVEFIEPFKELAALNGIIIKTALEQAEQTEEKESTTVKN